METEPPGLVRIRRVARLLDDSVRLPLTRFRIGLDPLLGVLPVAGDAVAALLSLYIVAEAARLGISGRTLARMLLNVGLDFAVGSVPVIGSLFDALWTANERNAALAAADLAQSDQTPF
ncbi:DUF4112 domain-containing protein [Halomicroarcula sp. GCM10025709]|uniref:DUF4112 domain-containing protein n=1 Tax=Haloarcula TaxID=2237 RepID=UPI0024C365D9|nr:DUF4112 domain-containing protein [Halomicroarcula sp. YJ-61-S]